MNSSKERLEEIVGRILLILVLAILLFYTYVRFYEHPYLGFRLDSAGRIILIHVDNPSTVPAVAHRPDVPTGGQAPGLQLDDRLVQINGLRWEDFRADLRQPLYEGVQPGQTVALQIERSGQLEDISWTLPGPNLDEVYHLAFNQVWLAYIFWAAGLLTLLNMRPKDERWRLMMLFNFLTAIWIVVGGNISFHHLREGAILLRMAVWFCVPVYLHLHWVFPKPLSKLPLPLVWGFYLLAGALALAEWFQKLPPASYNLGFWLAIGGSAILFLLHFIRQPETRRDLRLVIIAAALSFLFPVVIGLMSLFGAGALSYGGAAILSLPLLPFGYLYASYRGLLGDLEMRVNRLVSAWLFLILLGVILLPLMMWASAWTSWKEAMLFIAMVATFAAAVAAIYFFVPFQAFVEKRLMGIRLAPAQLLETYAARITACASSESLHKLIRDDLLPSLLVRQFAFLQFDEHGAPRLLFAVGVTEEQYPHETDIPGLVAAAGKYRPLARLTGGQPCPWVRLALLLKVVDKPTGLWLFGRRDPDDLYPQEDIPKLQSLADQTAIAQSNLLQAERIKTLYLVNIDRHEAERRDLARELHDSVLNQIAALQNSLDDPLPPGFQENYEKLTGRVREIASSLRPPMLNYGLKPAIKGLANTLTERANDTLRFTLEIQAEDGRIAPNIEQHLYRIVQEACENAVRHAKATRITIRGRLDPNEINLIIEDDGVGFQAGENFNLESLIAEKHFGLAGMMERAELIGAKFSIRPAPGTGTRIQVSWKRENGSAG